MYITFSEKLETTRGGRCYTYTINVGWTLSGQKVWVYLVRRYLDKTTNRWDNYFKSVTDVDGEIAPFEKKVSVTVGSDRFNSNYYGNCRIYVVVTKKPYTDYDQIVQEIPLQFWYQILRWQYSYNGRVIMPERAYYEPGDIIEVEERDVDSSSSTSHNHGVTLIWCIDDRRDTVEVSHCHTTSASSVSTRLKMTMPEDDNSHFIRWNGYSDYIDRSPSAGEVDINSLPNIFNNSRRYAELYSDFIDPIGGITSFHVKSGGSYKQSKTVYVKYGGVWKEAKEAYVKSGGVWKRA